jgi:hypothetical protein
MSGGVPAGAKNPNQELASYPLTPVSATVGNCGAAGERLAEVTASARIFPARTCDRYGGMLSITTCN